MPLMNVKLPFDMACATIRMIGRMTEQNLRTGQVLMQASLRQSVWASGWGRARATAIPSLTASSGDSGAPGMPPSALPGTVTPFRPRSTVVSNASMPDKARPETRTEA